MGTDMAMGEREIMLVDAAINGDTGCFEELYELYHRKVFALARMTVKKKSDAEDILRQTFLSAWRDLHTLNVPSAFSTWIQKIALNMCYSLLRKKSIAMLLDAVDDIEKFGEGATDGDLLPAAYAERDDLRASLGKIIDGLSEVQKQSVVLFYYNGLDVDEISYVMGCNTGTAKSRLFLARKAVRSEIDELEMRSGLKLCGVAGVQMLPFADLLAQQLEAQTISPAVSESILGTIDSDIN